MKIKEEKAGGIKTGGFKLEPDEDEDYSGFEDNVEEDQIAED